MFRYCCRFSTFTICTDANSDTSSPLATLRHQVATSCAVIMLRPLNTAGTVCSLLRMVLDVIPSSAMEAWITGSVKVSISMLVAALSLTVIIRVSRSWIVSTAPGVRSCSIPDPPT